MGIFCLFCLFLSYDRLGDVYDDTQVKENAVTLWYSFDITIGVFSVDYSFSFISCFCQSDYYFESKMV